VLLLDFAVQDCTTLSLRLLRLGKDVLDFWVFETQDPVEAWLYDRLRGRQCGRMLLLYLQ
jgi:hypothetical protein